MYYLSCTSATTPKSTTSQHSRSHCQHNGLLTVSAALPQGLGTRVRRTRSGHGGRENFSCSTTGPPLRATARPCAHCKVHKVHTKCTQHAHKMHTKCTAICTCALHAYIAMCTLLHMCTLQCAHGQFCENDYHSRPTTRMPNRGLTTASGHVYREKREARATCMHMPMPAS